MPTNFDGSVAVGFGVSDPSGEASAVGSGVITERGANQWIITLLAAGGDVTIDTSVIDPVLWWLVRGVWREDIRPWDIAPILVVKDGRGMEDLIRARVDAEAAYLRIPAPVGGTLTIQLSPVMGGS